METKESSKDLKYYKENCEENYLHTPISVLRYISELETENEKLKSDNKELLECLEELYVSCRPVNVIKNHTSFGCTFENYVGACGIPSDEAIHKANDLIQKQSKDE